MCDGKKAAAMAMDYLISRGRKCIAYIGDCTDESRYAGYRDALARGGMPLNGRIR
jgi:DNA-binding LacI/PurR family transcriptional regulator